MSLTQYEKLTKELRETSPRNTEKIAELKEQKGEVLSKLLGPSAAAPDRERGIGDSRKKVKAKIDEINNS